MITMKVVALFDDSAALDRAREELAGSGLARPECIHVESNIDEQAESRATSLWDRLKNYFESESSEEAAAYAEGMRRGGALLVVETSDEKADAVKDVLRSCGAVDLRRRVLRWISAGWQSFDPGSPMFSELEILDERRAAIAEAGIAADAGIPDSPDKTVALFLEPTGEALGHISEAELGVLRDALEEEGPDDDDYWINKEEIEEIAGRPGATPHLIALLRRAVASRPDGADIRFERSNDRPT